MVREILNTPMAIKATAVQMAMVIPRIMGCQNSRMASNNSTMPRISSHRHISDYHP